MNRRLALIQAALSLVALGAVVWWAAHQDAPRFPDSAGALALLGLAMVIYGAATAVRAERWHHILKLTGVRAPRSHCYGLTTVGYMGNNVLPARAGEALRVVLLSQRTGAGKRTVTGTIVAERVLDVIALGSILAVVVTLTIDRDVLPTEHPVLIGSVAVAVLIVGIAGLEFLRRRGSMVRVREFIRPLADAPRALIRKEGVWLLGVTFVLWMLEGAVYLAVAEAVKLNISVSGALYLVALTNFVAALPAAPGSIGTFDAAVAFGARALGGAGAVVVSYLLLLRFILYVPITVVGLVVLVVRYGGWARLRSAARLAPSRA
ncbi:MAG: flippase-like domain-containing protein [Actinomycetota bacterium]|nr:flippase-like domain-containing protein [Actinomycetota bacterium]MDQ3720287.1 flippase-like domain-containing protein [Actinomycetota bacterium]